MIIVPFSPRSFSKERREREMLSGSSKFGACVPSFNILEGVKDIILNLISNLNKKSYRFR
jgi:hypothetical protein